MPAKIRLKRVGRRGQPSYRVVVVDESHARDSQVVEELGFFNPIEDQLNVTGYTIQTGAFRDRDNALRAANDLATAAENLGLPQPRLLDSTDTRGSRVTLVQIGEFATFASARAFADRLGVGDAVIVPLAGS